MKKTLLQSIFLLWGYMLQLQAENLIQNGSFENGVDGWTLKGKCSLETNDKIDGIQSLLVTKKNNRGFDEIRQEIKVQPDTDYELTYYVKCCDLVRSNPNVKIYGVSLYLSGGGKRLCYGSEGMWKYDNGSFDWKKVVIRFNTKTFKNPGSILLGLQCPSANGTFLLDAVTLQIVKKRSYSVDLFPLRFLKGKTYSIAENLVGTIFLTSTKEKTVKYATGTQAVMTLDLPSFIHLAGVTDRFIIKRQGKYSQVAYPFTVRNITRNGKPYRRYIISFDSHFIQFLGESWYYQKIFLLPGKDSAGKKGMICWSLTIGKDVQAERCHPIAIHKPILNPDAPCKRFSLDIGYSSVHVSPFNDLRKKMNSYWKKLSVKPSVQLEMGQGSDPDYSMICVLKGDDSFVDMPHGRAAWNEYRKKTLKDVKVTGGIMQTSPSWFKLEDPDQLYESYLRNSLRTALKLHPEIKVIVWDYEPERTGYDPEGRKRFAHELNLEHTPSITEIQQQYRSQWRKYTLNLNARFISKVAKIVKDEAPGCRFVVTSEQLRNKKVSNWCDVDMRLIDQDRNIDMLQGMPYFCGAEFFDDIRYNLSVIRKPMIFSQNPSERIWSFFRQYTPDRLYQNILAVAALGGKGICHWPDDSMSAEYYQCFADAYGLIAQYEDVYFDGKRIDHEFTLTPQNTVTKTISDGMKTYMINFPDFKSSLRMTAHEYRGKYILTLFNYNETEAVIVQIKGKGKNFLASIPAAGAKVIDTEHLENQEVLTKILNKFKKRKSADHIKNLSDGVNSVRWVINSAGKPVLRLANANFKADIDAMNNGELIGFCQKSGADPMAGGSAARVIFYDTNQPALSFKQKEITLQNGISCISFEAEVSAYEGAIPYENPLLGLKIRRTFALTSDGLKISISLFNPSKHVMYCGFRIWNYPQTGSRFGRENLTLSCAGVTIESSAVENHHFLKNLPGEKIAKSNAKKAAYYLWKGEKVLSSSSNGILKEQLEFIPGPGFDGIYVWNSNGVTPGHTVELKTPNLKLQPRAEIEFTYLIQ